MSVYINLRKNLVIVNSQGTLDLRKIGLRNKCRVLSLEDYSRIISKKRVALESNYRLANLFLFKAIIQARVELYIAGEERSVLVKQGKKVGLTPDLAALGQFLKTIAANFPFGSMTERVMIKDGIEIAALLINKKMNTAADAKLVGLFNDLKNIITREMRPASKPFAPKVEQVKGGGWVVRLSGYKKSEVEIKFREKIDREMQTAELLRMFGHISESIETERQKNTESMIKMALVKSRLPDGWAELYELHLQFANCPSLLKAKVEAELYGALQLSRIGSTQALGLAKELIEMAENDLEHRQSELSAQADRFKKLQTGTEIEIKGKIEAFSQEIVELLTNKDNLMKAENVARAKIRLEAYEQKALGGKEAEGWLKETKENMVNAAALLEMVIKQIDKKAQIRSEIISTKERYLAGLTNIQQKVVEQSAKRFSIVSNIADQRLKDLIGQLGNLNAEILAGLATAAGESGLSSSREKSQRVLKKFNNLNEELVEVLGFDGRPIGTVLGTENDLLKLESRQLTQLKLL